MTVEGEHPKVEVRAPAVAPPSRRDAAAALLAGALVGPSAALAQTPPASPPPASPPAPGASSTETLKTGTDLAERMTAKAYVNGEGPFHFLVDTGANRSGISTELALQLKLPPGNPVRVHGIAAPFLAQTVDINELRFGSIRLKLDDAPMFARADLGADGLIGLDILHDRAVSLDFDRRVIEITSRGSLQTVVNLFGPSGGATVVPARQRFGQLTIIDAEAGHAKMTCFIDTGAEKSVGNMALKTAVEARMRPDEILNAHVLIRSATGQTMPAVLALVPSMRIGGIYFTRFAMAFADLHTFEIWELTDKPALLVGMDLLGLFSQVEVDFGRREVSFQTK